MPGRHLLAIYRALLVAQIQSAAQYRVQMLLWLLLAIVRPVIFLSAWVAVARSQGGSVGAYSTGEFAAYYVALALVTQLTMAWNAWEFEAEVRHGRLSPKLLRPLHPIHYGVVENLVWKGFTLLALIPVLALIAWTFGAEFHTGPEQWFLFVPSVLLAAALRFVANWLLATVAFWTTRVSAVVTLFDRFVFIFAGYIAPISLLPGPFAAIAFILPFGSMLGVPAEILRGGVTLDRALLLIAWQAVWLVVALAAFAAAWRSGVRQYSAVGA